MFLLLIHFLFTSSVDCNQLARKDTCKLFEVKIDKPFREIVKYYSYYRNFEGNDTSDYQLISISIPYDDSYGHLVYYKVTDTTSISTVGNAIDMRVKQFDKLQTECFRKKLTVIREGGYACICDLNSPRLVYSICMIRKKGNVIYQYQGVNKNLLNLEEEGEKIENVIALIKMLRK